MDRLTPDEFRDYMGEAIRRARRMGKTLPIPLDWNKVAKLSTEELRQHLLKDFKAIMAEMKKSTDRAAQSPSKKVSRIVLEGYGKTMYYIQRIIEMLEAYGPP
jgi:hypothetical protein